jgi:hypothetical protein
MLIYWAIFERKIKEGNLRRRRLFQRVKQRMELMELMELGGWQV